MLKIVKKLISILLCIVFLFSFCFIKANVTVKGAGGFSNVNGHFENEMLASNQKTVVANDGTKKIMISESQGNRYLVLPSPDSELPSGKSAYSFAQTITGLDTSSEYYISFRFKCESTIEGWAFMVGLFDNIDSLGALPYVPDWRYVTPNNFKISTGGASFVNNADHGVIISDVTSTDWQYATIRFTPNNAWTSFVVTPFNKNFGNICIDDIIVGIVATSGKTIINGGFDNGTYSAWEKTETLSYCQVVSDPENPENPVLYIPAVGKQQQRNIYQKLDNLIVGKKYLLSFRMKYSNISATESSWQNFVGISNKALDFSVAIWGNVEPESIDYIGTDFTGHNIGEDSSGLMKVSAASSTEWQEYKISFVADSKTAYFYFNNYYGKADVYLDDITLAFYYQKYDINCDESIDIRDLVALKKYLSGLSAADFNDNGADIDESDVIDSADLIFLRKKLLGIASSDIRTLKINTSSPTYEGFGGVSALYTGYHFHDDTTWRAYSDEELAWEIEQVKNSGISMVRANFYVSWAWDYKNNRYDYNSTDMQAFYEYAQLLKDNDIDIGIVLNDRIYQSLDGRRNPFVILSGESDHDKCAAEMGKFAKDFVNEVILKRGFNNIKYFEMFTEPGSVYFSTDYTVEDRKTEFDNNLKYYKAIHNELTASGLRDKIKIMGPNVAMHHLYEPYITYANDWLKWAVQYADEYIDIYSMHTYSRLSYTIDDYDTWLSFIDYAREIIEPTGKKFFIDEFGYSPSDDTENTLTSGKFYNNLTGVHLVNAYVSIMNSGFVSGASIWSLADEKWTGNYDGSEFYRGIQICGYGIPNLRISNELKPNYYLLSLLGKVVKNGCTVYSANSKNNGVNSTYVVNSDGTVSVITVNMTENAVDCSFEFNSDIGVSNLAKYEFGENTVAKELLSSYTTVNTNSERIIDTIPPYTVVIYSSSVIE